ncbi:MAG: SurA N-terminal domain-containing protein [Alistipes sp.]|nr:SurA N-terminal domain-containing protein [Alistipes sp.]
MASLNTLRTKYGIVLSVVIALVLVAFILGDQLSMRSQRGEIVDNTVLTIDGKEIKQSDYYAYTQKYAMEGATPDQNAQLVYQQILFNEYLHPAYQAAGLGYSAADEEVMYRMNAENYIANTPAALTMSAADLKKEIDGYWNYMKMMYGGDFAPMVASQKASAAYVAGKFANSLEVNEDLRNANLTFDGHYVMLPYSAIACEEATEAEIEAFYNAHRVENANYGARKLAIVRFDIVASEADKAAAEAAIMEADAAVKAAKDSKEIKSALRGVNGKVENYVAISSLSDEEAKAINAGKSYGPVLSNDAWTAKYIVSKVNAPESYTFSAITAESNAAAEKLVEDIKAVKGNLAELEAGANATTKSIKMTELNERNAEKFIAAKVGDVFTYTVDNKPAAVVITELGKKDAFVLTADVNYAVTASAETYSAITAQAETLMKESGKTPESFNETAAKLGKFAIPYSVSRGANPATVTPVIRGIEDSRNTAIWAYDAKVGEKKSWTAKNIAYVCMVTEVDNQKYMAKNDEEIKRSLENEKKFNAVKETLTMDSAVEGIKSGKFEGVNFGSNFAGDVRDMALAGAIARSTKVGEPTIVKGNTGVYLFVVDQINNTEAVVNADVEAKRKEMNEARKAEAGRNFENYMMDGVEVVDNRGAGEL